MFSTIGGLIGKAIANGVIDALDRYQKQMQIERMQAEILEGWAFKIQQSVQDACIKSGVSHEAYAAIDEAVKATVAKEFDNRKI